MACVAFKEMECKVQWVDNHNTKRLILIAHEERMG